MLWWLLACPPRTTAEILCGSASARCGDGADAATRWGYLVYPVTLLGARCTRAPGHRRQPGARAEGLIAGLVARPRMSPGALFSYCRTRRTVATTAVYQLVPVGWLPLYDSGHAAVDDRAPRVQRGAQQRDRIDQVAQRVAGISTIATPEADADSAAGSPRSSEVDTPTATTTSDRAQPHQDQHGDVPDRPGLFEQVPRQRAARGDRTSPGSREPDHVVHKGTRVHRRGQSGEHRDPDQERPRRTGRALAAFRDPDA